MFEREVIWAPSRLAFERALYPMTKGWQRRPLDSSILTCEVWVCSCTILAPDGHARFLVLCSSSADRDSRSSLFDWNWMVFLVVPFSQCHQCKVVSTSPSEPLPIHILCHRSYILCNNRYTTVYVIAHTVMENNVLCNIVPTNAPIACFFFSEEQISEEFHRQTKSNSSFSHDQLRYIYT